MTSSPKIDEEKEGGFAFAMQLFTVSVLPMALKTAIDLGVFEIIAKAGPGAKLSASDIVARMSARNSDAPMMVDRILRLLASHGVVGCSLNGLERLYGLAPVSKYFVRDEDGILLAPSLALDKVHLDGWARLKEAVLEGGVAFDMVHGTHAFEYPGQDPSYNEDFNAVMSNQTTIVIKNILEVYKGFENVKQLVDVGGSLGTSLKAITSKYPHIKGINFDLPHVIEHAPQYPGLEHVGGDMFESVPKGDAIFLKCVLHDWSDEHCLKLLKNCFKSIPENGKVIVVETVMPVMPETSVAAKSISQLDVIMMAQGGKERTRHELMALATGAGFSGIRYECFVCNFWVMEFYK